MSSFLLESSNREELRQALNEIQCKAMILKDMSWPTRVLFDTAFSSKKDNEELCSFYAAILLQVERISTEIYDKLNEVM